MIRLLIVEDHPVVRAGLAQLLGTAEDIEIIGVAADGEEAVRPLRVTISPRRAGRSARRIGVIRNRVGIDATAARATARGS